MSSVDTARDVAVLWTLDFDAELPCESAHSYPGNETCSGRATHRFANCKLVIPCCTAHAANVKIRMARSMCIECGSPAFECWSIRPI